MMLCDALTFLCSDAVLSLENYECEDVVQLVADRLYRTNSNV